MKRDFRQKKFFIGTIFEVKNSNQQINTIDKETNTEWSVTLNINGTNICNKTNNNNIKDHAKHILWKQYTSNMTMYFRLNFSRQLNIIKRKRSIL